MLNLNYKHVKTAGLRLSVVSLPNPNKSPGYWDPLFPGFLCYPPPNPRATGTLSLLGCLPTPQPKSPGHKYPLPPGFSLTSTKARATGTLSFLVSFDTPHQIPGATGTYTFLHLLFTPQQNPAWLKTPTTQVFLGNSPKSLQNG